MPRHKTNLTEVASVRAVLNGQTNQPAGDLELLLLQVLLDCGKGNKENHCKGNSWMNIHQVRNQGPG